MSTESRTFATAGESHCFAIERQQMQLTTGQVNECDDPQTSAVPSLTHSHHNQDSSSSSCSNDKSTALVCQKMNLQKISIRPTMNRSSLKSQPVLSTRLLFRNLLNLLIINAILGNLEHLNYIIVSPDKSELATTATSDLLHRPAYLFSLPKIILADAVECKLDNDCSNRDKICHENKCICHREKPIEDQDRCLALALINEQCSLNEQCLGNSVCIDGICSCGSEGISLFNPSAKIYYCHPKRRLNQECNYDSQCPNNGYCSTDKYGCLCQNGFAQGTVLNGAVESLECLAKSCTNSSTCESEYHTCEDNKCICVATHFDPTTAKCYKFGSTGGKPSDNDLAGNTTNVFSDDDNGYSIFKDLTENSDKMWLVLIILISLSILIFIFIFMLVRKHYLGYCWKAHKKEYEPNNKSQPKNGYFNKNSINNKSFRQKNVEVEDEDEDSAADRSNLVTSSNKSIGHANRSGLMKSKTAEDNHYVRVNMSDHQDNDDPQQARQYQQVSAGSPLKTSTSTPV